MNSYIGIDLGTSSVKLLLVTAEGEILQSVSKEYPISYPQNGWSEQNPEDWYNQVINGIKELLMNQDKDAVKGIGISGQMHGLVLLDEQDSVIRPAILWNDGRTEKQTMYLNSVIGKTKLSEETANIAFAGFTAPKILWVKENEPENFAKIRKIMLPKDYVVYRLTGRHVTDYSDASGMLLLDVKNKCWSKEMCDICSVSSDMLPELHESYDAIGTVKEKIASDLGLSKEVILCAGAGDNAAAAIGTGTIDHGSCNVSLGTSGTIFISQDQFSVDQNNSLHSFCHANGRYHLMGCILSAASCSKWWMEEILHTKDFISEQDGIDAWLGKNDVYFLPYLMGERSPYNDVFARGAFIGLRPDTTRKQMTLSVLEGVAFALRDCLEIARLNGLDISSTRICGGGAKSKVWKQIIADVFDMPVETLVTEEGPSFGGAMLSMVAAKEYESVTDVVKALVQTKEIIYPDKERALLYQKKYETYHALYPALKDVFRKL